MKREEDMQPDIGHSMQKLAEAPQTVRVLIVEDNQAHQQILCDLLAEEGFDVAACGSAAEALACLGREDFAVAIVDQRLPDHSGTDLLMQLHAVRPALRAIIHTGHASLSGGTLVGRGVVLAGDRAR